MVRQGHVDVVRNEALIEPIPRTKRGRSSKEQELGCPSSSVDSSLVSSTNTSHLSSISKPVIVQEPYEPLEVKIVNDKQKIEATQFKDTGDQEIINSNQVKQPEPPQKEKEKSSQFF